MSTSGNRQAIVESALYVERLANTGGNDRARDNSLTESGIGRRENGGQHGRSPEGQVVEEQVSDRRPEQDSERHGHAQQTQGQLEIFLELGKRDAGGIGEENDHESDLRQEMGELGSVVAFERSKNTGTHGEANGDENHRRRENGAVQSLRYQTE